MYKAEVDVPVMLLFFNRPDPLKEVFKRVKECRPSTLFLVQDGPREGRMDDKENVLKCREIVSDIDWECDVHKNYSEVNLSCDHCEYMGIDWCFGFVDRLIILEDDCVPARTFFSFCEELLEIYKNDTRIDRISGLNRIGRYNGIQSDYFFSTISAGWGWATWKRTWEEIKKLRYGGFLEDADLLETYRYSKDTIADKNYGDMIAQGRQIDLASNTVASWEYLVGLNSIINDHLIITPRRNMISNIGATPNATHFEASLNEVGKKVRRILSMETYDVEFPLKHPNYVLRDVRYEKMHYRRIHIGRLEGLYYKVRRMLIRAGKGDYDAIWKSVRRRLTR